MSPASLANLKKFKPGASGNPKGRSKEWACPVAVLRRQLTKSGDIEGIMAKLREMALAGNLEAIKLILDRVVGKVTDKVELSGAVSVSETASLAQYTREELEQLRAIQLAATARSAN